VVASVLTGDPERAWRLTRPAPEGEATEAESGARTIVEHAAMTAALTDRLESARELLEGVTDQYARLSVIAVLAEKGEIVDPTYPGPEAAWRAAYSAANNDSERLQSARGLGDHGIRAEGLDDLAAEYPQAVDEIRAISAAMAPGDDQLVRLRAGANTSPGIAVRLAELYAESDRPEESAAVLHDAGERWGSPQLLAMAAEQYRRAGLPAEALESIHQALSTSSQEWHGRRACQALLVELYSEAEEWPRAVEAARALLESRPDDRDANWALVRCLHAQRDFEQAWHALTREGAPRAPRSNVEALVWLDICRRHAPPTKFYGLMLTTLDEWKHDERVYAAFVQTFLMSPPESAPSPEESQRIQAAIADFTRTFPESDYLKAITIDEENPLASFPRELLEHDKAVDEIHDRVRSGALPIGALATAVGRTFTEASLRRVAGAVYTHRRDEPGTAAETVSRAKMVVIDPTAIHTLALVSDSLAAFALGSVPSVTTTTSLFDDALLARESLAQRSTLSVEWDPDDQQPALRGISDEQAERLADLSSRVVALMSRIRRLPRRELRHFGDLKRLKDAGWLTALDLAKDRGCPYWTDDLILRDLARSMGVEAVGSLRIFELCTLLPGGPSREQLAVESATLLSNYYVDLPFSDEVWRLSATADGWRPSGAAFALTRPPTWQDPASASAFLLEAIDHVRDEDPLALRGWVTSGALGLGRVAGNNGAASGNLQILGRTLLSKPWVRPHHVPFLADGIRAAATELGLEDPLPPIVTKYYEDVLGAANSHALAAAYMRMLFSQSDEATQRLAARVVILAPLDEGP
jgi:tetratricopeptide (TPR) repeat protein